MTNQDIHSLHHVIVTGCHRPDRWPWPERVILGMGGYAVVYRLLGLAVKLGRVTSPEADTQRLFAARGLALPVLAYYPELAGLPDPVRREVCPRHGVRREILPAPAPCRCAELPAALVMPLTDAHATIEPDDLRTFIMGFSREAEQSGLVWDARPANVARYQGRLVALDFGEPS